MSRTEDIVIQLPLSMLVAGAVMQAIGDVFPTAMAVTDHNHGSDKLVIRVNPDEADPDAPYEDDDDPGAGTLEPTEADRKENP